MAPAKPAETRPADPDSARALEKLAAGTAIRAGAEFFPALVTHLTEALEVGFALVAETLTESRARTLAFRTPRGLEPAGEWDLAGTPCAEGTEQNGLVHVPRSASREFPRDARLVSLGIEGYLSTTLVAPDGRPLGHLCAFDTRALPLGKEQLDLFRIFAARAAAELARLAVERTLGESEERFRDLFDEAPIAYVHEGLDTRFIRANRAAIRAFGIRPEDASTTA